MGELKKNVSSDKLKTWKDMPTSYQENKDCQHNILEIVLSWLAWKYLRFLAVPKKESATIMRSEWKLLLMMVWLLIPAGGLTICFYFDVQLAAMIVSMMTLVVLFEDYQKDDRHKQASTQRNNSGLHFFKAKGRGTYENLDYRCRCQKPRTKKKRDDSTSPPISLPLGEGECEEVEEQDDDDLLPPNDVQHDAEEITCPE